VLLVRQRSVLQRIATTFGYAFGFRPIPLCGENGTNYRQPQPHFRSLGIIEGHVHLIIEGHVHLIIHINDV
jgi:hypothetical protein